MAMLLFIVKETIKKRKQKIQPKQAKPMLCDPDVKSYLEALHKRFVVVTIDKAANNFTFICKKYYISKLLAEVGPSNSKYKICLKVTYSMKIIIQVNINYCKKFDLNIIEVNKSLPIMYWLPKMRKTRIGSRFIVASKNCNTKPLSDTIPKIFNLIFNIVESFRNKSFFYQGCKKFWDVQNYFPIVTNLIKISVNKKAGSISAFEFSTLYTTASHKLLLKMLSEVIISVFKSKVRKRTDFSKTSVISKGAGRRYFLKQTLANATSFLINKCFFAWFFK